MYGIYACSIEHEHVEQRSLFGVEICMRILSRKSQQLDIWVCGHTAGTSIFVQHLYSICTAFVKLCKYYIAGCCAWWEFLDHSQRYYYLCGNFHRKNCISFCEWIFEFSLNAEVQRVLCLYVTICYNYFQYASYKISLLWLEYGKDGYQKVYRFQGTRTGQINESNSVETSAGHLNQFSIILIKSRHFRNET